MHDGDELSEQKTANVWEKRRLDQQQKEKEGKENDRRERSSEEKDVEKQSEKTSGEIFFMLMNFCVVSFI